MIALDAAAVDALLGRVHTGRLGVLDGDEVYVVPVGFVWVEGSIWFHSAPGRKTRALAGNPRCCFEVDEYDPATADWCSVICWGRARPDSSPAAWAAMRRRFGHVLHRVLTRDASVNPGGRLWRLEVDRLTGRRGP